MLNANQSATDTQTMTAQRKEKQTQARRLDPQRTQTTSNSTNANRDLLTKAQHAVVNLRETEHVSEAECIALLKCKYV